MNTFEKDKEEIKKYHDNGKIWKHYQINSKGQKDGFFKIYFDNGTLQTEVQFKDDIQLPQTIISYHKNGVKAREVIIDKAGFFNGPFTEWYENEKVKRIGHYKDDECFVESEYEYDSDGVMRIKKFVQALSKEKETLRKNQSDNTQEIKMIVTFANTIFSDYPKSYKLIEKCNNDFSEFVKISNKCIKAEFDMPTDLKDHLEVLKYDIDVSEAFPNGNNYITLDLDCTVTFFIKSNFNKAVDEIEKYQQENDDLRWNLSINWVDPNDNMHYSFDSWDSDMIEDIINEEPIWYED